MARVEHGAHFANFSMLGPIDGNFISFVVPHDDLYVFVKGVKVSQFVDNVCEIYQYVSQNLTSSFDAKNF